MVEIITPFDNLFLSTPSGWRATRQASICRVQTPQVSIHALRVEGDGFFNLRLAVALKVSIHALRVEGDTFEVSAKTTPQVSIHALWVEGDPGVPFDTKSANMVSIHALRVEGDISDDDLPF